MARTSLFTLLGALASALDETARRAPAQARAVTAAPIDHAWWLLGRAFERALLGKLVLVPVSLAIYAVLLPWCTPYASVNSADFLLTIGLVWLCGGYQIYESLEWLTRSWRHTVADTGAEDDARIAWLLKGAMRTDVVVSIQCVALANLSLSWIPFDVRVLGVALVAFGLAAMYAPIAAIVLLARLGLRMRDAGACAAASGRVLLALAPWLLRGLSLLAVVVALLFGAVLVIETGHWFFFPLPEEGMIK